MSNHAEKPGSNGPDEDALTNRDDILEAASEEDAQDTPPETRITDALQQLPLFDDLFLRMQALNLEMVDAYMEDLETQLLREYIEIEHTPVQSAVLVSALSQLWVFGLYELLRTWRQRASEVLRFAEEVRALPEVDREKRIAEQRERIKKASEAALDLTYYWKPFDLAMRDGEFVDKLRNAVDSSEVLFRRIESLRVSLAKHEVPKSKGVFAMAPGYGRIDMTTGSIYWQIVLQGKQVDILSRRALADECRRIGQDRSNAILLLQIQKRVSELPREGYGLTRIAVKVDDGTEYDEVIVAWSKEVVWVKGDYDRMPFDARKIVEVRSVAAPPEVTQATSSAETLPAELLSEEQENK